VSWTLTYYLGIPLSGKTHAALERAAQLVSESGNPLLVIDPEGASNFDHLPRRASVREVIEAVWGRREHAVYTPPILDGPEVDQLASAVRAGRDVVLLVDEVAAFLSAYKGRGESPLLRLFRGRRHARAHILCTTQHPGDLPEVVLGTAPELIVFRCDGERALKRLSERGLDPEVVSKLPPRESLRSFRGFTEEEIDAA
jgi:hypothetical protein